MRLNQRLGKEMRLTGPAPAPCAFVSGRRQQRPSPARGLDLQGGHLVVNLALRLRRVNMPGPDHHGILQPLGPC